MLCVPHPGSGDTHLISDFAAHLLRQLSPEPSALEDIVERISPDIEPGELEETTAAIPELLHLLADLGVVETL